MCCYYHAYLVAAGVELIVEPSGASGSVLCAPVAEAGLDCSQTRQVLNTTATTANPLYTTTLHRKREGERLGLRWSQLAVIHSAGFILRGL